LHILFVHSNAAEVERCLQELDKVHFTVSAEVVVTPEEFSERLGSHAYDLVVAELTSPDWQETQALELLHRSKWQIPLIFVGGTLQRETVAEFLTKGAYDCIEMEHIGHLPVAVRRALQEKTLREERDRAKNGLGHSEARHLALAGNLTYGICRCDLDGKFLEVNEAMVKMLGYASREELMAVNLAIVAILFFIGFLKPTTFGGEKPRQSASAKNAIEKITAPELRYRLLAISRMSGFAISTPIRSFVLSEKKRTH
jgi:PAS domain-containing protein